MPSRANVFTSCMGLHADALDPARLPNDPETGTIWLAEAWNVEVDDSRRVGRKRGYELWTAQAGHSIWRAPGGDCLFVSGTNLMRLGSDGSVGTVRSGLSHGARTRFLQILDRTYWGNGWQHGYIKNGVAHDWEESTYSGPRQNVVTSIVPAHSLNPNHEDEKTLTALTAPPPGRIFEHFNGRIFLAGEGAYQDFLLFTEAWHHLWYAPASNFYPMESRVRMVRAMPDGLWVGTDRDTRFLAYQGESEQGHPLLRLVTIIPYPVVEGTDLHVDLEEVQGGQLGSGQAVIVTAKKGICLGLPGGVWRNLTPGRVRDIEADTGWAYIHRGQYRAVLGT